MLTATTRPSIRPTTRQIKSKWIDHIPPLELKTSNSVATLSSFLESASKRVPLSDDDQAILQYKQQLFSLGATLINSGKAYAAHDLMFTDFDIAKQQVEQRAREDHEYLASDVTSELMTIYNSISKSSSSKMYAAHDFVHTRHHYLFVCRVALDHLQPTFVLHLFEKALKTQVDLSLANMVGLYIQFNLDKYKHIMNSKQIGDLFQTMIQFKLNKDNPEVIKLLNVKLLEQWQAKWKQSKLSKQHRRPALAINVLAEARQEILHERAKPTLSINTKDLTVGVAVDVPATVSEETKPAVTMAPVLERLPTTLRMDTPPLVSDMKSDKKSTEDTAALCHALVIAAKNAKERYAKKYDDKMKASYFFSRILDYGQEGQQRAADFVQQLTTQSEKQIDGLGEIFALYKNHFTRIEHRLTGSHAGNLYDDSFDSMLLQAMVENSVVAGYFKLTPEQLLDMAARDRARAGVISQMDAVIVAKAETPLAQMLR